MGQLRSGILNLQKTLVEMEPKIAKVSATGLGWETRICELGEKAAQGYDLIQLYLMEKFKKSNTTIDAQGAKKLKEVMDPHLLDLIKGMLQWQNDLKAMIGKQNAELKAAEDALLQSVNQVATEATQLKALAEKKKDKLFKSAKYKEKIKGYLAALESVQGLVPKFRSEIAEAAAAQKTTAWVDRCFGITPDMTCAQLKGKGSATLNDNLKNYNENKAQIDNYVRKFRDTYKTIPGQMAVMKKWVDDADGMEAEK